MSPTSIAAHAAMDRQNNSRSVQLLMGIISGMVADGELNNLEIQFLNTWLSENGDMTECWPGSAIARHLREILADGVITAEERKHFLQTLNGFIGHDFANTGSASASTAELPYDHDHAPAFSGTRVCHTGEFIYGTRTACEVLTAKAGAIASPSVNRKVSYLIVGTHVSPNWLTTSYGRKIMQAIDLRTDGHTINILPEKLWMAHIG